MSRKLNTDLLIILIAVPILWFAPSGLKSYGLYVVSLWLVMSIAAMGLNLTLGYAGLTSLAQGAFLGIGAYATAILTAKAGWPLPAAFLVSTGLSFLVGVVLGFPALRVKHHYLAFVTLAFSVVVFLVARNEQWLTGGVYGLANIPRPVLFGTDLGGGLAFYRTVLVVTLALTLVMWWLLHSPWGRAFQALRENPLRAASLGVDIRAYTLLAFAIGSAFGGAAGSLYAPLVEFIDPAPFALSASFVLLLTVVAGGAGSFFGPFVGAFFSYMLPELLRATGGWYLIIYAAVVLVLVMVSPTGLLGLIDRWRDHQSQRRAAAIRAAARPTLASADKPTLENQGAAP
ncbi:branched-chain amino acid ABC transporter permease [Azospirillum griseum]|uniref:Branched-chain amino acid ABC transporter permease n=1 Tax=Azospirillum griseum TaxID=2496639 RepID=A0A3S0K1M0_9PROT|nr:branched-chain amino acid ABC transporter permease [Azospirillum griseum]RTR15096.1 branched-chain amino acid ABC transporter permease [Azospirillum griseum]